jgi:glycosyltransferase involved in cell wall biosynthesis
MRIAVLAHNLHGGGGRSVGSNLLRALPEAAERDEFLLVAPVGEDYTSPASTDRIRTYRVDVRGTVGRLRFETQGLPRLIRAFRPDWVLSLGNVPVRRGPYRRAVLVHDPHLFAPRRHMCSAPNAACLKKALLRSWLSVSAAGIDVAFCQTRTAARALSLTFPRLPTPTIVPNVVSAKLAAGDGPAEPTAEPSGDGSFVLLTVSRYYPHKNLEIVLEAFERFPELMDGVEWWITVSPDHGRRARALLGKITKSPIGSRIRNLGPVPQARLGGLYAAADAVILPTRMESFSANYPEAMYFGVPILTSGLDFAHEICGDAALYFDPSDARSVARAVARARDDAALRDSLVGKGREILGTFPSDWAEVAGTMIAALESA